MKHPVILLLLISACATRPAETESATDSLALATDTVATTPVTQADATPLPEALKDHPLAEYHGEYRLRSTSSAEQARMTITFEGDNKFTYSINYNVADFCSDDSSGSFTVENGVGYDPVEPQEDANRPSYFTGQITFTMGDGMIKVADGINEFGVGKCNLSGDFFKCDGPCPAIASEDYGIEDGEGDAEGDAVR